MFNTSRKSAKTKATKTTINKIVNNLRKDILFGRLKPDEHLKEYKLAAFYKVSRVPIREAFRILHSEGYVEMIPNRGSYVKRVSRDFFYESAAVYKLIGPVVLKDSIPRYKENTYKKAYDILDKVEKSKDFNKTSHLLWDFAKVIFSKSKYEFMKCIIDEIYMQNIRAIADIVLNIQQMDYDTSPHKAFLSLCKSGKNDEAVDHWINYVSKLSETFQKFIKEQENSK